MSLIDLFKSSSILLFPPKKLDDLDTRKIFLKKGIHLGDLQADLPKGIPGPTAEEEGEDEDERQDGEGDQSKLPIEVEKDDEDSSQKENVFHKVDQNGGEHFMDILDIVGQTGHQPSHRVSIKKGDGEALKMGEDLHPKIMHDPLTRHLHGIDLKEIESKIGR